MIFMSKLWIPFFLIILTSCQTFKKDYKIDRFKLVNRHNIVVEDFNPLNSLSIGNGEFAYTADFTGMQSFPEYYQNGISLGTMSQWGWHSFPNRNNYSLEDVAKTYWSGDDSVSYVYQFSQNEGSRKFNASEWLRQNPHRIHLGFIGLEFVDEDSLSISKISDIYQKLDIWTGILESNFKYENIPVNVISVCHQDSDIISFHIKSELLKNEKLKIKIRFPFPAFNKFNPGYSVINDDVYSSSLLNVSDSGVTIQRQLDSFTYFSKLEWNVKSKIIEERKNAFLVSPSPGIDEFEITCHFSESLNGSSLPVFKETLSNSKEIMRSFWESGAAVDFSNCNDSSAYELERRVVLSQYLTKIQSSGSLPPQETGLTYNSWYGKFHLEMHWWNTAHFISWGRAELMEKQLDYYFNIVEKARSTAIKQGYHGVRWPKMTDPEGNESPSNIGTFLIWQQPHIIYFTDMLYNYHGKDTSVLKKYFSIIEPTADFMSSYSRFDSIENRYFLGPALIPAQESFNPETTINPVFELVYWRWALAKALEYRNILGLEVDEKWQHVIDNISSLPVADSLYLFSENANDSYINPRYLSDHPIVTGICGLIPYNDFVDKKIMGNSLDKIIESWNFETCWGWDFPMMAMCAASLGRYKQATDILLMDTPKNKYLLNGHNYQDESLRIYLPGNGSLLSAVAFLCQKNAFQEKWDVRFENFPDVFD